MTSPRPNGPWRRRVTGSGGDALNPAAHAKLQPLVPAGDFPAATRSAYLNAASVAPIYRGAHDAIVDWQETLARFGTIEFDEAAEDAVFEGLREAGARLFRSSPEDIAIASSATEFLASLAWGIAPAAGTNVVGTDVAFPSTVYPWARVCRHTGAELRLVRGANGWVDPDELVAAIDDRTAVVCVSHVEYASGQMYDLGRLGEAAHARGALLVVDATQSAGAVPLDPAAAGVDALVTAGYKWLCGPFGAALLYVAPALREDLEPGLVGWRSHREIWDLAADRLELSPSARRFEFSTMAYGCAVGLTRSIEFLVDLGVDRIHGYDRALARILRDGLAERGARLRPPDDREGTAIVSAEFPGRDPGRIAAGLNAASVVVSGRGGRVRFSPHLYNSVEDLESALDVLDEVLASEGW